MGDQPNAIEKAFSDEQIDELVASLRALPPGQRTLRYIQEWGAARGAKYSLMAARTFRDSTFEERLAELRDKREAAELIVQAADAGKGITDAGMSLAVKRRFDQLMSGESLDDETLSTIMLDLSRARAGDQRGKKLEADLAALKQRMQMQQFDAAKAALEHAKELRLIAGDTTSTSAEKLERARLRLFGAAPEGLRPLGETHGKEQRPREEGN